MSRPIGIPGPDGLVNVQGLPHTPLSRRVHLAREPTRVVPSHGLEESFVVEEQEFLVRHPVVVQTAVRRARFDGRAVEPELDEAAVDVPAPEGLGDVQQRLEALLGLAAEELVPAHDVGVHVEVQPVLLLELPQRVQIQGVGARLLDRRDPVPVAGLDAASDAFLDDGQRRNGQLGPRGARGRLEEFPRHGAVLGPADEHAPGRRLGRVGVQVHPAQRLAVDKYLVPAHLADQDGRRGEDVVEVLAVRPALREQAGEVEVADDPVAHDVGIPAVTHVSLQVRGDGLFGRLPPNVGLPDLAFAGHQEVRVCVVDPRHDEPAAEVVGGQATSVGDGHDLGVVAHRLEDAVPRYHKPGGPRPGLVDCEDLTVYVGNGIVVGFGRVVLCHFQ